MPDMTFFVDNLEVALRRAGISFCIDRADAVVKTVATGRAPEVQAARFDLTVYGVGEPMKPPPLKCGCGTFFNHAQAHCGCPCHG